MFFYSRTSTLLYKKGSTAVAAVSKESDLRFSQISADLKIFLKTTDVLFPGAIYIRIYIKTVKKLGFLTGH
jgi:hypothetical protein